MQFNGTLLSEELQPGLFKWRVTSTHPTLSNPPEIIIPFPWGNPLKSNPHGALFKHSRARRDQAHLL